MRLRVAPSVAFVVAMVFVVSCTGRHHPPAAVGAGDARMVESSPQDGETGVAIRRETVLRFDRPVDRASLDAQSLYASVGGERLPARIHVAPDGLTVTLFYAGDGLPAHAEVLITLDGDRARSANGHGLDADGDGFVGGVGKFSFETLDLTVVPNTDVCGRVFESSLEKNARNLPLRGVTIHVDGLPGKTATTDALGNFCLRNLPAGRIFVHIDGSTVDARPVGWYYPNVGKAWHTKAGERVQIDTVYLPRIAETTLQVVSKSKPTVVHMSGQQLGRIRDAGLRQQLGKVSVTVPAGSLFDDGGQRGGRVGIAPVDPKRLPGTTPQGLRFALVITVQTDGPTNFDRPVSVLFPNLPDPLTKVRLAPGAKTALWSFNHDSGRFEVVGTMTVTNDGRFVASDPGVGIRAPGWHGTAPGSGADGGPPKAGGDCTGPDCCKKKTLDLWAEVLAAGKTLAECAEALAGIDLGCLTALVEHSKTVYDFAVSVRDTIHEGTSRAELIAVKTKLHELIKNWVDIINKCKSAADPVERLQSALGCAEGILHQLNNLCDTYLKCTKIWGRDLACTLTQGAETLVDVVKDALKIAQDYIDKGIQKLALTAADKALKWVCKLLEPESSRTLTAEEAKETRRLLRALASAVPSEKLGNDMLRTIPAAATNSADLALATGRDGSRTANHEGVPREAEFAYAVELIGKAAGTIRRGRTNTRGRMRLILPPSTTYALHMYDAKTRQFGVTVGKTAASGRPTRLSEVFLREVATLPDTDADGLVDAAELVYGTRIDKPDTDGDGVSDGEEVHSGKDPLDGIDARVRIVAEVDTPAPALDVCVAQGVAITALGKGHGIEAINTWSGLAPARIASVQTPGDALRVACGGLLVAVADGSEGLAVVDLRNPRDVKVRHQLRIGDVRAVAARGVIAFAGTSDGQVLMVDMAEGLVLARASVRGSITDVALRGDWVYASSGSTLTPIRIDKARLRASPAIALPRSSFRMFAAADHLFATHRQGYASLDVATDPSKPRLLAITDTSRRGWRQLVTDGSGFGIGVAGNNVGPGVTDTIDLYDVRDRSKPGTFVRRYDDLPFHGSAKFAEAIPSAAVVDNGLAYLADRNTYAGKGKLVVLRYQALDLGTKPPEVRVTSNVPSAGIEEGKLAWFRAAVRDDVQVRNVDFYVDGVRVMSDSSYPFELAMTAPAHATNSSFVVKARAWDSGGNAADSTELKVVVLPDTTAPTIVTRDPGTNGAVVAGAAVTVRVTFSEPVVPSTLSKDRLRLTHAGPDGKLGTADDVAVPTQSVAYRPLLATAIWKAKLPKGAVRAQIVAGIRDVAGNALKPVSWNFTAYEGLRLRVFSTHSVSGLRSFFAGRVPETFTEYRPGRAPVQRFDAVIPNVHFPAWSIPWMVHAGVDGKVQTRNPASPLGDDATFVSRRRGSYFGAVAEGTLRIPAQGKFVFSVVIDDAFFLEIDGKTIVSHTGGSASERFTAKPIELDKGTVSVRISWADTLSVRSACTLEASGPGFPGGVIPARFFGSK